jgi:hypothetical protein
MSPLAKNLKEVIRRNERSGSLVVFDDVESGARQAGGIFLAEDDPEKLGEVAVRIAELAYKPPVLVIVTLVPLNNT